MSTYRMAYRRTISGRATTYLSYLARFCRKKGLAFDLTYDWFEQRIKYGRCEQTGIPFVFDAPPHRNRSSWAFSVDRIDPREGYVITNSQAVVWAYNAAKGSGCDQDVVFLAKCLLGIVPLSERGVISVLPISMKDKTPGG